MQKLVFTSGLNSDLAPEIYPEGASPFRLNTRTLSSTNGQKGVAETVNGNTLVSFTLPTGTNTCIGYEYFPEVKKGYAFIYNSAGKHLILEFDSQYKFITNVLQDKNTFDTTLVALNFKKNFLITGIDLVILDSDNHLLYFSDGYANPSNAADYNEPKKLNIQKAKLYMSSSGTDAKGYPKPFDKHWIDAIKKPPQRPSYVWSGLDTEPEWAFNVGLSNTQNFALSGADISYPNGYLKPPLITRSSQTVKIDFNTGSNPTGFDYAKDEWTVQYTGFNKFKASFALQLVYDPPIFFDGTGGGVDVLFVIKNETKGVNIAEQYMAGIFATPAKTIELGAIVEADVDDKISVYATFYNYITKPAVIMVGQNYYPLGSFFVGAYIGTELPNLRNDLFKVLPTFQASFIYDDKEESVLSKISSWVFPRTVASPDPKSQDDYYLQDDTITVTLETGSPIVTDINVYVKKITEGNVLSDALFVTRLNKKQLGISNDTTYDFTFKNDGTYTPISLVKANQLFDNIPYYAKSQEIFKNRIGYGAPTELTDAVSADVLMPVTYGILDEYSTNPYFPKKLNWKSGSTHILGIAYYGNGGRVGTTNTVSGDSTKLQNMGTYGTTINIPFLTQDQYDAPKDNVPTFLKYVPIIQGQIYHAPPKDATHYEWIWSKDQNISKYIQFVSEYVEYRNSIDGIAAATSADHVTIWIGNIIGIYKRDNQNSQLVYDWTKGDRIRFIAQVPTQGAEPNELYAYNDTEIYNFDPATQTINIKMSDGVPTDLSWFTMFEIYSPANLSGTTNQLMYETGCGGTITTQFNSKNLIHAPSTGKSQSFISFTSNSRSFANPETFTLNGSFSTLVSINDNAKIKGTSGWSIYGVVTASSSSSITINTTGFDLFGTHNTLGGELVIAAEQSFNFGDTFRRKSHMSYEYVRGSGTGYSLKQYIETMDASNMFDSQAWDYGRPNRIDNNSKRIKRPATIVYSEKNIQETNINGLNKIYDGNFESYENDFGDIWKLFYRNEQLEAYQELKVAPIPVGQQVITTSAGQQSLTTSDAVLGKNRQFEYYDALSGIGQHPESFATYGTRRYYFDVNNGGVYRLSTDGQTDISETAGMKKYFSDLCAKILRAKNKVNIYGVYDIRHDCYVLSISPFRYDFSVGNEGTLFDGATLAYHEPSKMWSDAYSFRPDFMGQNGIDIVTFKNGALYTHDDNVLQATFYGQFTAPELWVVVNETPSKEKIMKAIALGNKNAWEIYSITTPDGQETNIIESEFQFKENQNYASVNMDINTPVELPLINGEPLRSRTFLVKMRYNKNTYTNLPFVNINLQDSERSDK